MSLDASDTTKLASMHCTPFKSCEILGCGACGRTLQGTKGTRVQVWGQEQVECALKSRYMLICCVLPQDCERRVGHHLSLPGVIADLSHTACEDTFLHCWSRAHKGVAQRA